MDLYDNRPTQQYHRDTINAISFLFTVTAKVRNDIILLNMILLKTATIKLTLLVPNHLTVWVV